jgi:hypothetical protein
MADARESLSTKLNALEGLTPEERVLVEGFVQGIIFEILLSIQQVCEL